jgi:hypothetical protein
MEPTEQQIKRVNAAFDRVNDAIVKYLNICTNNDSPVKSLTVQTNLLGGHCKTTVRYRRWPKH